MVKKHFRCDIKWCNQVLSTKYSLKRHLLKHLDCKDFVCKTCGKKFCLNQYLVEHEFTHSREKPYVCGINGCPLSFRQRGKYSNMHNSRLDLVSIRSFACTRTSRRRNNPSPRSLRRANLMSTSTPLSLIYLVTSQIKKIYL